MTLTEIDRVPDFGVVQSDSDVDREILFKQANTLRSDMRAIINSLGVENAALKARDEALANNCMRMGSDIHALEAENAELRERIKELEEAQTRAYDVLGSYGVPRDRAGSVANGIDVLAIRDLKAALVMDDAVFDLNQKLVIAKRHNAAICAEQRERDAKIANEQWGMSEHDSSDYDQGWDGACLAIEGAIRSGKE